MDKRLAKIVKLLKEAAPTNSVGSNPAGYSSNAAAAGPCAGFDPYLFPAADDTLSQDFQTPAETGEDMYATYSGIYPVMKVSLSSNLGDGPSIDQMVQASNEYVNMMANRSEEVRMKNFSSFMEEANTQKCPQGQYWCYTHKKCRPIPTGYHIGVRGRLEQDEDGKKNGNGNGNGSHNGNGNGNGNGGGNGGGNGNGGGGNGGGE